MIDRPRGLGLPGGEIVYLCGEIMFAISRCRSQTPTHAARELFFPMEIQLENCPALVVALVMDVHVDVLVVNENIHHFCNCITVLCTLMWYAANRPRTLMFECPGE